MIDAIQGPFRKHLTVVEDEAGLIRMYYGVKDDHLAVLTSRDGIHWEKPVLAPGADEALQNVVLGEPAATGVVFIDPNGPAVEFGDPCQLTRLSLKLQNLCRRANARRGRGSAQTAVQAVSFPI